jgi:hypothetical protein
MFQRYLQSIKPTTKGTLAILIIVFIIPVLVDLISLPFIGDSGFSLFRFVIGNYFVMIPVLFIYLLVFYLLYAGWKNISEKGKHEKVKSFEFEKTDE